MMQVLLMYPDRDFDPNQKPAPETEDLIQDLELERVFAAMARDDDFLYATARKALLLGTNNIDTVLYRQEILKDSLEHVDLIKRMYGLSLEFLKRKHEQWIWISSLHSSPSSILSSSRRMLEASLDLLKNLRRIADNSATLFQSRGFQRFFTMIQEELEDEYLRVVEKQIKALKFPDGVLLSGRLGRGNEGTQYLLCRAKGNNRHWLRQIFTAKTTGYSYRLHPRDNQGARMLGDLRDRGIARVANAVAQAADNIEFFFTKLRVELGFYLACVNLHDQLTHLREPVAFPKPVPHEKRCFSCTGLYDAVLALTMQQKVTGNTIHAAGKALLMVTGPNRGGKTTFLHSVGVAQLLMQAGIFVPAQSFTANLYTGIFTHFKREEDKAMESGKFEEELKRMRKIIEHVSPDSLILLNESFAATNEREGSEIAEQIISALIDKGMKVFYVTHLYELARRFYARDSQDILFLRAERLADGTRTFKIREAKPLQTSFAADLYQRIFGMKTE